MQKIVVTVGPTFSPVWASDLLAYLRLNDTTESVLLQQLADAASDLFTVHTGTVLAASTLQLRLDCWPSGGTVYVPRSPVNAVSLVEYLDTAGVWQTLTGWTADTASTPARVQLPTSLPNLHDTQRPAVRVTFTAGYASSSAIPPAALVAVKLLASHWYENRSAYTPDNLADLPAGWNALTSRFALQVGGNWNA